jgi:tripartite-type tricarboxylate transporter receptor subunit TctC
MYSMRITGVDLKCAGLYQLGLQQCGFFVRNDLVVVALHEEPRHRDRFQVFGLVSLGEGLDAFMELFRSRAAIEMQHVPYRGMPQALTDVLAGEIDCVFADPASAQELIQDGRLRVLAVTSSERLAGMPDVPTLAQAGLSGAELAAWVGVFVRAGTPSDIIAKLSQAVLAFVNSKETAGYLESVGAKPFPAGPDALRAFEEADTRRWAEIVAIAKIEKK